MALFYFAGHGVQASIQDGDGQNWLLATQLDTCQSNLDIPEHAVKAQQILERIESRGCLFNLLILDCCRDNLGRVHRGLETPALHL